MAIKNVVSRGFAFLGTIKDVVLRGYSLGAGKEVLTGNSYIYEEITGDSTITEEVTGDSEIV